ncbi:MAG: prolipoprotein diacylglyceryl transferase [Chloroflexota bacterium]|jgi:phosphatidylglycerol---prolipoprotein diacylglyceryl transferase
MFDGIRVDPVAFTIPIGDGFPIYWYGIIVTIGIALGTWWGAREIKKRNQNVDEYFNGLILVVFSGYIFARLSYVLIEAFAGRGSQFQSFLDIINIRSGGINILGGFIGAAVVGYFYLRWRRLNFWQYADVAGPALLLAQSIGRWGNFINQELYGPPTTLPWGLLIDAPFRLPQFSDLTQFPLDTRFHPTFLYESLWLFLGFLVLVFLNNRYRDIWRPGTLFGLFLIWWGSGRAILEIFRPDQATIGATPITYSMIMSISLTVAGLVIVLSRNGKMPELFGKRRRRVVKPKPRRQT